MQFGLWSFSIYLYQQPFFKRVNDGKAQALHLIVPAILCGIASYYFIEKPARAMLNKRFALPPAAQPGRQCVLRRTASGHRRGLKFRQ